MKRPRAGKFGGDREDLRREIVRVVCPTCSAPALRNCKTFSGQETNTPHLPRVWAWREAKNKGLLG